MRQEYGSAAGAGGYFSGPVPGRQPGGNGQWWIITGVVFTVAAFAIGLVVGVVAGERYGAPTAASPGTAGTSGDTVTSAPAPPQPVASPDGAPGTYSTTGIADACELVDSTPLYRWASTPVEAPQHAEYPPSATDGGYLSCTVRYTTEGVEIDSVGIGFEAETAGADGAEYDRWKEFDLAVIADGASWGEVTGIGAQGYWRITPADTGLTYTMAVQDVNVSVRVQVSALRPDTEPPVSAEDLAPIAEQQVRRALDGLRQ